MTNDEAVARLTARWRQKPEEVARAQAAMEFIDFLAGHMGFSRQQYVAALVEAVYVEGARALKARKAYEDEE
jgi:hypothetical protein